MNLSPAGPCILFVLIMSVAVSVPAQDMSRLATPLGYQLPYLEKGEFILSAYGDSYGFEQTVIYETPNDEYHVEQSEYALGAFGVFGLSDRLVLRAGVKYIPSQDTVDLVSASDMSSYERHDNIDASIQPDIMLAFRPKRALEFAAQYYRLTEITALNYEGVSNTPSAIELSNDYLRLSVTYSGRLP